MGEFIVFVSTLFFFGTASAFVVQYFRRQNRKLDSGVDHEVLARVLEETDTLSSRLDRVEEELEFFRKLNSPGPRGEISAPKEEPTDAQEPPSAPQSASE